MHSVFARAANLACDDGRLLTVLAADVPRVAHGVRLRDAVGPLSDWFAPGAACRWEHGDLFIESRWEMPVCVSTDAAALWRCELCTGAGDADRLARALANLGTLRRGNHFAAQAMSGRVAALADAYNEGDGGAIERAVHRLVGLGPGLTPAGDDALIGWLAGTALLRTQRRRDILCRAIRMRLGRTTDISRAHLDDALAGEFSEPLAHFANALLVSSAQAAAALTRLARVGASSGMDAAYGLFAAVETCARDAVCHA